MIFFLLLCRYFGIEDASSFAGEFNMTDVRYLKKKSEMSGYFAKVGAPQAGSDSSNPPETFHKTAFWIEIYYTVIANCLFNLS